MQQDVIIDYKRVIDVADKKFEGWNITPDMVSSCVIASRFMNNNKRSEAVEDVKRVVDSVHTTRFDEMYTSLYHKYGKGKDE